MIGIVFGCFCPMHQGHLDLIMRAKKENDYCVVICCGYDFDRGKDFLPLEKRYRYVKKFFEKDELVKVMKLNDTELGIDQNWCKENWIPWLEEVKKQVSSFHLPIRFYVSEPNYKEELEEYGETVILCERKNPISGTMIRENPLKYWNKIVPTFHKVFSHNILIIGTASEGKTTLVKDLGAYFTLPYSYEKGRDCVNFKDDTELDCSDFVYNIYEQNKLNKSLIESNENHGIFLSDTDNLVTLMYAKEYATNENFKLSLEDYETVLLPLAKMYARKLRWNKIYVLAPHEKFVDDGIRCLVHSGYEERTHLYHILLDLLKEFHYDYEILDGTYYENFLKIKNDIEEELK